MSTDMNEIEIVETEGNKELVVTIKQSIIPQKIFLKPANNYGVASSARNKSSVEDYLKVLREESLSITREGRTLTFKLGEGDSYQTGFYLDLAADKETPLKLAVSAERKFAIIYTGSDKIRVDFEVI
jgi:hypothetical protein